MFLTLLIFLCFNTVTKQESPNKCQNSVCIPYSECSEVQEMLKNNALLNQTRELYCGYAQEPLVCCKRNCKTPNGNYGNIVNIDECPHLKQNRYTTDRQKWNFLRESEVNRTHVCCRKGEDTYIVVPPAPVVQIPKLSCLTPNGEIGTCVEVKNCKAYQETISEVDEKFRFMNDSYCGWWSTPMVCCGTAHDYKEDYATNLPIDLECGKWDSENPQQKLPPWLVFITDANLKDGCVGALINDFYVLSSTRCFTSFTNPDIHVGECITNPTINRCRFKPSKVITFPLHKYHRSEDTGVVLIKLNHEVQLPEAPICLPSSILPLGIDIDILGVDKEQGAWSPFQITTLSIENQICENELTDFYVNRIVCIENPICEGNKRNLLHYVIAQYDNNRWFLEGLMNREHCYGRDNNLFHAVSVYKFVAWIKSNIS